MAGTDLRAGTDPQPDKVITHDGNGNLGTGEGQEIPSLNLAKVVSGVLTDYEGNNLQDIISLEGENLALLNPIRRVITGTAGEGLFEFMAIGVDLAANGDTTLRVGSVTGARGSVHVEGHIVGGTNDSTRIAAAKFILNKYSTDSSSGYYEIGEALNGFIHPDNDSIYGPIFSAVDIYLTTNGYMRLKITNGSSIKATGCTIFLQVTRSNSV